MNVVIGNCRIEAGKQYGFDLYQTREIETRENGVKTGATHSKEVWVGFYGNLDSVAKKLIWLGMSDSNATDLAKLIEVVQSVNNQIVEKINDKE